MMLMVVKIWRKLGLNTLWRCSKSWRISSHLKIHTWKVSSLVLALLSWPYVLVGDYCGKYRKDWWCVKYSSLFLSFCCNPFSDGSFYILFLFARQPRGFGFVQFVDPADAAEAKYQMDGHVLLGREVTVVFAEENRKKPSDMRHREGPR